VAGDPSSGGSTSAPTSCADPDYAVHVDRTVDLPLVQVRPALTLALMGLASLLVASVLAPSMSAESVVVLAALTTATTARLGIRHLPVLPVRAARVLPALWADEVLPHLAGRSTDVDHHPLRPRAPGLV